MLALCRYPGAEKNTLEDISLFCTLNRPRGCAGPQRRWQVHHDQGADRRAGAGLWGRPGATPTCAWPTWRSTPSTTSSSTWRRRPTSTSGGGTPSARTARTCPRSTRKVRGPAALQSAVYWPLIESLLLLEHSDRQQLATCHPLGCTLCVLFPGCIYGVASHCRMMYSSGSCCKSAY